MTDQPTHEKVFFLHGKELPPANQPMTQQQKLSTLVSDCRAAHQELIDSMPDTVENDRQQALKDQHGTPREFARCCVAAIGDISVDEARGAILKYQTQWGLA